jgi:hypothetical protein
VKVAAVDSRLEAAAPQSFLGGYFDEAAINRTCSEWGSLRVRPYHPAIMTDNEIAVVLPLTVVGLM